MVHPYRIFVLMLLFVINGCTSSKGLFEPELYVRYPVEQFEFSAPRLTKEKLEEWGVTVLPIRPLPLKKDASWSERYGEIYNPTGWDLYLVPSIVGKSLTTHLMMERSDLYWPPQYVMHDREGYMLLGFEDDSVGSLQDFIEDDVFSYGNLVKLEPYKTKQIQLSTSYYYDKKPGETYAYFWTYFAVECNHVRNKPPLFYKPISQYLRYVLHQRHEGNIVNITPKRHRGDMVTIFNSPGVLFYHEAEFTIPEDG